MVCNAKGEGQVKASELAEKLRHVVNTEGDFDVVWSDTQLPLLQTPKDVFVYHNDTFRAIGLAGGDL